MALWLLLLHILTWSSGKVLNLAEPARIPRDINRGDHWGSFWEWLMNIIWAVGELEGSFQDFEDLKSNVQHLRSRGDDITIQVDDRDVQVLTFEDRSDDVDQGKCSGDTCTRQRTGVTLPAGSKLVSANGHVTLAMQTDGNLVIYCEGKGVLWQTGTNGHSIGGLSFQGDGNLVLYDQSEKPIWYSGTHGTDANKLVILNNGNLVLYGMGVRHVYWQSNTTGEC